MQSVPGPGEKPQTYETREPLTARLAWNALTSRLSRPQELNLSTRQLYLDGTSTQLQVGDAILIIGDERLGYAISERWDFRILERVEPDTDSDRTLIAWSPPLGTHPRRQRCCPHEKGPGSTPCASVPPSSGTTPPDPRILGAATPLTDLATGADWIEL